MRGGGHEPAVPGAGAEALLTALMTSGRVDQGQAHELVDGAQPLARLLAEWQSLGIPVHRDAQGLVWSAQHPPLSAVAIAGCLASRGEHCEVAVDVLTDSTNARLRCVPPGLPVPRVLLAECQTEGRGRRQRAWQARYGEAILMSVLLDCPRPPAELPGVAIVAGLAVTAALRNRGVAGVGVKWPNDVMLGGGKLAGILVESAAGSGRIVIGIGLNWSGAGRLASTLARPVAALAAALPVPVDRNDIAAEVLTALIQYVRRFAAQGLRAFLDEYAQVDTLAGQPVWISTPDTQSRFGHARGLAPDGGLMVDHGGTVSSYRSAEVSVVPA